MTATILPIDSDHRLALCDSILAPDDPTALRALAVLVTLYRESGYAALARGLAGRGLTEARRHARLVVENEQ